jgi:hypothetical protein
MTVPVLPFEAKLASPDGTATMPRTSISFCVTDVCALTVTNTAKMKIKERILVCMMQTVYGPVKSAVTVSFNRIKRLIEETIYAMGEGTA